ncbi:AraC family transcriptional regulator [Halotalea alkalilenta]|uniref:AraC family transcriptional regulator n=1 Tax=Halotalea alkalilenta TaxID=376489 RepID=UPI000480772F|nr:AraC family transcriptional regulator [Halotalea alkalilenta]
MAHSDNRMTQNNTKTLKDRSQRYSLPVQRFEKLQTILRCSALSPRLHDDMPQEALEWSAYAHHFGKLITGMIALSPMRLNRSLEQRFSAPDHALILIVVSGMMVCRCYGNTTSLLPGDILIQDLSQPIDLDIILPPDREQAEFQFIFIPRSSLDFNIDIGSLHGHSLTAASPLNRLLRQNFSSMLELFDAMNDEEIMTIGKSGLSVLLNILGLVSGKEVLNLIEKGSTLEKICLYIEANLATPISIDELCRKFALSRTSLYRLFEPLGGVATHIRNRRLAMAARMFRMPSMAHLTIAAIARRCGLEVHVLRHHFTTLYGTSLRGLRKKMLDGTASGGNDQSELMNWMSRL